MLNPQALQLRVGVDVGSRCHHIAARQTASAISVSPGAALSCRRDARFTESLIPSQ